MTSATRRLLFIYTGGTLGMVQTDAGWAPGADLEAWLDDQMAEQFPGVAHDFVALDPLVDSSSATPLTWQRILDVIDAHHDSHDAFVVLHGTDTLAFTAAALTFALSGTGIPVVLTGSQRSIVRKDSDAPDNVRGAIRSALDDRLNGVALFFDDRLLEGQHASKISTTDDHAFESMDAAPLALRVGKDLVFTPGERSPLPSAPAERQPFREAAIVVIQLHPALSSARVDAMLTPAPEAVIVRAYGSGNAPEDDPQLLSALAGASAAGSVVVVTTQCAHGGVDLGHYASSQPLLDAGAVAGGTLTTEALVAGLTFLLSQGLDADQIRTTLGAATA